LPGEVTAQGCAVAQQPTRRRRALDGDLGRREDARHGGRATPPVFAWRGAGCCVTAGHHRPGGSGDARLASAARTRQRPRAREAAPGRRPKSGQSPAFPRRHHRPGGPPRLRLRFPSRPARALVRCVRAEARRVACRRRVLEAFCRESCHRGEPVPFVLRRVMRDTRPPADLRYSKARIAACADVTRGITPPLPTR
jgi:hypothetical protein